MSGKSPSRDVRARRHCPGPHAIAFIAPFVLPLYMMSLLNTTAGLRPKFLVQSNLIQIIVLVVVAATSRSWQLGDAHIANPFRA